MARSASCSDTTRTCPTSQARGSAQRFLTTATPWSTLTSSQRGPAGSQYGAGDALADTTTASASSAALGAIRRARLEAEPFATSATSKIKASYDGNKEPRLRKGG